MLSEITFLSGTSKELVELANPIITAQSPMSESDLVEIQIQNKEKFNFMKEVLASAISSSEPQALLGAGP